MRENGGYARGGRRSWPFRAGSPLRKTVLTAGRMVEMLSGRRVNRNLDFLDQPRFQQRFHLRMAERQRTMPPSPQGRWRQHSAHGVWASSKCMNVVHRSSRSDASTVAVAFKPRSHAPARSVAERRLKNDSLRSQGLVWRRSAMRCGAASSHPERRSQIGCVGGWGERAEIRAGQTTRASRTGRLGRTVERCPHSKNSRPLLAQYSTPIREN
jgi:hypothetical protein